MFCIVQNADMESLFGCYVSCIKIGNQPIIPPLLDDERRAEMRYYRQRAIDLENRRKPRTPSISDSGSSIKTPEPVTVKEPISNGSDNLSVDPCEFLPTMSDSEGLVPGTRERSNSYTLETPSPLLLAFMQSLRNEQSPNDDCNEGENEPDEQSEELMASASILEQLTLEDLEIDRQSETKSSKRKLWDVDVESKPRQPVSLPGSFYVSPKKVQRSYESDDCLVYKDNYEYMEKAESQVSQGEPAPRKNSSPSTPNHPSEHNGANDSFNKDFCMLDTSVNLSRDVDAGRESTFSDCSSVSLNKFIPSLNKKSTECHDAEYEAFMYFKEQLRMKHRQQLALLLEEQQREHDLLKEQFQKISRASSCPKNSANSTPANKFSHDTYTKKPSPNKHKSPVILDDVVRVQFPIRTPVTSPKKETNPLKALSPVIPPYKPINPVVSPIRILSCSGPPKKRPVLAAPNELTHRAASKINAAVRGYLTRRLFKTSRIQLLVQTIKDCLITAVSIQNETNLGLPELDLQNRLLQQLTTACNELNDIFALPTKERMIIIADDREKKKREAKRTHTPLPLSEATRRSLQRKLTNSAPNCEKKQYRKRCKSASSVRSDSSISNNIPSQRRLVSSNSFSHRDTVRQPNRKPWR